MATLDTKGQEVEFLSEIIENNKVISVIIDLSMGISNLGSTQLTPDFPREEVLKSGGKLWE